MSSNTMALIDQMAADLAAERGAPFKAPIPAARNPYINHYGKILDPEKAAGWMLEQHAAQRAHREAAE